MSTTLHDAIAAARAGDTHHAQLLAADNVRQNPDDANAWYLLSQLVDSDARRAAYLGKTLALDPDHARARIEFDALPPALTAELAPAGVLGTGAAMVYDVADAAAVDVATADFPAHEATAPATLVSVPVAAFPPGTVPDGEEIVTVAVGGPGAADTLPGDVPNWLRADEAGSVDEGTAPVVVGPGTPELMGVDTPLMTAGSDVTGWGQPLSPEAVHADMAYGKVEAGAAEAAAVSAEYSRTQAPRPAPRPAAPRPGAPPKSRNGGNQALSILFGLLALLTLVVLGFLLYLLFF